MTHDLPRFSIIIPTYNRPRPLAACLSVLSALDYPRDRFEVIVVDDGSRRPVKGVVDQFGLGLDARVVRQSNAGPAAARNAGAAVARGQIFAFTDDDCTPDRLWLRELSRRLTAMPGCLCGGRTVNRLVANPYAATSQLIVDVCYAHFNPQPDRATFFASNNMAMPADRFAAMGGFDPRFRVSEDRNLCDRWHARGWPMVYAPRAVVGHAHALTFARFWWQHFQYGRGARRFHGGRSADGRSRFSPDWAFYGRFLKCPGQVRPLSRAAAIAGLLGVWQLANAAGFYWDAVAQAHGGRGHPLAAPVGAAPQVHC